MSNHFDPNETLNISASHPERSYRDCCYPSSNVAIASGRLKNENVFNVKLSLRVGSEIDNPELKL